MGFLHFILADSTISSRSDYENVMKTKPVFGNQRTIDQTFSNISMFLILLHFFWFLFGSINILPAVFIEGLSIKDKLRINNCDEEIHFWFSFFCICLQWFLFIMVAIWYNVETSIEYVEDETHTSSSGEATDLIPDRQQDNCQYHSFPKPSY
eukprot:GFUD01091236.1.p1 GENE.GFUD01091236.1~~GFUD01091236.1.p1  ORF type:complete len:152 (-),score=25.55 GFUD01091236.1:60-515(-)